MNILQESSPRVAAHRQRTAEESLLTKKQVIQNLSIALKEANNEKEQAQKDLKQYRAFVQKQLDDLKAKIIAYQSTSWSTRAWLLVRELFGHRTELI